ncbi:MAG: hypothetical protein ACAI18_00830 [Gemmatimonadales bacterium]
MRSHVTFKTPRFNQTEVRQHFINDCCFGEDCIAWLIGELRGRGWTDLTEAWQEDWGWQTSGKRDGRRYLLSVGLIPEDEPEWLVHIGEKAPLLDRLRGRGEPKVLPKLAPALHEVLRSASDVGDVSWHFEDEFMRGTSTGGADPAAPRSGGGVTT